ncbi:dihydroorotase [Vallitalea okinawensis]|uniref:dihydroorotase n=1 Tax=Vallitalea okinawensis TaxID=2078660 RepID=UPI000CFE0D09|nr:dihydroorotase [Vallitalea okinawensis]
MKLLIKKGRVINPANDLDGIFDLLISQGKVKEIGENLDAKADQVIDAKGKWVVPGFVDLHVHLREPGFEYKETIESGCKAAAAGGYTTICAMPNTRPVVDNEKVVEYIQQKASTSKVNVLVIGAITKGQEGKELADVESMTRAGVCGLSEDGKTVKSSVLMKKAMLESKKFDLTIMCHCEDEELAGKGVINHGDKANALELKGIPNESEDIIVARDLMLAKHTGAKVHICHVSTAGAVKQIDIAKEEGVEATAEVTPHHFTLTEEDIKEHDTDYKMNPPLRKSEDRLALIRGLKNGSIDVIATDHAPHHMNDKNSTMNEAAFGIIGLETALPLSITELVEQGYLSPVELIEKMSLNPSRVLGIQKGDISEGQVADIAIIDPKESYIIDKNMMASKSKNTPFHGRKVNGKVKYTIAEGHIIYSDNHE